MGLTFSKPNATVSAYDAKYQLTGSLDNISLFESAVPVAFLPSATSSSSAPVNSQKATVTISETTNPEEVIFDRLPVGPLVELTRDYYNMDCKETDDAKKSISIKVNPNLTFNGRPLHFDLAAHFILWGNDYAMQIICLPAKTSIPPTIKNTSSGSAATAAAVATTKCTTTADILKITLRARDPRHRWVESNLLGMALMARSVDPIPNLKKHYGFAEQIIESGLITDEDIKTTFNRTLPIYDPNNPSDAKVPVGPNKKPYWQRVTDARMQRFVDANKELGEAILNDEVQLPPSENAEKREASLPVQRYRKKIKPDTDEVIKVGLLFDPMVAFSCIKFMRERQESLSMGVYPSDVYAIINIGSMLGLFAADDAQVVNHTFLEDDYTGEEIIQLPMRSLIRKDKSAYYSSDPTGLGFTLDDKEIAASVTLGHGARTNYNDDKPLCQTAPLYACGGCLMWNKSSNLERLTQQHSQTTGATLQNSSTATP